MTPNEIVQALSENLFNQLLRLREDGEFCIVDRTSSRDFYEIFKDGVNGYNEHAFLAERLFRKSSCVEDEVDVYSMSEETAKLYEEFRDFMQTEDAHENEEKIKQYEKMLENNPPVITKKKNFSYKNDFLRSEGFLNLLPLEEIPEDILKIFSDMMAMFAYNYFNSIYMFLGTTSHTLNVISVKEVYDDFVDVIITVAGPQDAPAESGD